MKFSNIFHRCGFCENFAPAGDGFGTCRIAKDDHPEITHPEGFYHAGGCVFPRSFKEMRGKTE